MRLALLAPGTTFRLPGEPPATYRLLYCVGTMRAYVRPLSTRRVEVKTAEGEALAFERPAGPENWSVETEVEII